MKLNFKLNKPIAFVFDYLTDMQKYASVHPIISKIEDTGDNTYIVHETLKMGFIPFYFTYPVTLESNLTDKTVVIRATIMKMTKIEMNFKLTTDKNYTLVEEIITFKSPLPIKQMMAGIFKKQHELLFKNIENLPL